MYIVYGTLRIDARTSPVSRMSEEKKTMYTYLYNIQGVMGLIFEDMNKKIHFYVYKRLKIMLQ